MKTPRPGFSFPGTTIDVVAVVASGGGLDALTRVLAPLPVDFPAAIVVVQHVSPAHKSLLAPILAGRSDLPIKEAAAGDRLAPGHVYVAPPDWHVLVLRDGTLALTQTPRVRHVRPAGDVLFASLAGACGPRAAAVVLTGGDANGAAGVRLVKAAGGLVVAEDPETARHPDMPQAAIATGCVDHVLPAGRIGPFLDQAIRANHNEPVAAQ